jgi:hypothetical protein
MYAVQTSYNRAAPVFDDSDDVAGEHWEGKKVMYL